MSDRRLTVVACVLFVIALGAWIGVGILFLSVSHMRASFATRASQKSADAQKTADAEVLHALVREITPDQQVLDTFAQIDPIAFADVIRAGGTSLGVPIQISDAMPSGALGKPAKGTQPLYAFSYTVEAHGSFAAMIRVLQLFETLPAPTSMEQFNLSHAPDAADSASGDWHLTARIRLITSSNIAS